RLLIERNAALACRRRFAPPRLTFGQLRNRVLAGPGHLRRASHRRRHYLAADHDDPKIVSFVELLQQDGVTEPLCQSYRFVELVRGSAVDGDALALFSAGRLDDDASMLAQKSMVLFAAACLALRRHGQPGPFEDATGDGFVVAQAHRDGAGQFGERLAADDRLAT